MILLYIVFVNDCSWKNHLLPRRLRALHATKNLFIAVVLRHLRTSMTFRYPFSYLRLWIIWYLGDGGEWNNLKKLCWLYERKNCVLWFWRENRPTYIWQHYISRCISRETKRNYALTSYYSHQMVHRTIHSLQMDVNLTGDLKKVLRKSNRLKRKLSVTVNTGNVSAISDNWAATIVHTKSAYSLNLSFPVFFLFFIFFNTIF